MAIIGTIANGSHSLTFTSSCVVHLHAPFSGAMPLG